MTGICAGIRGKTDIGDILVADPCFDWGSGKWLIDPKSGELKFRPAPYQWRLSDGLSAAIKSASTSAGILKAIHDSFVGERPSNVPRLRVEAMASGASVLQASRLMDDFSDPHKNLLGSAMVTY